MASNDAAPVTPKFNTSAPTSTVETAVSSNRSMTFEAPAGHNGEGTVTERDTRGITTELAEFAEAEAAELGTAEAGKVLEEVVEGDDKPKDAGEGDKEKSEETPDDADLGEFNPGDAESVKRYDAKYLKEDGKLNEQAIGLEFWQNRAKSDKPNESGHLNPGTYKWLEDTFQLSHEFVTQVEEGLVASQTGKEAAFYASIDGGKEAFNAAVAWGKKGGYTEAQRDRFNAALNKGGEDRAEAVEALMSRYSKATGNRTDAGNKRLPGRRGQRPSSPARDATATAEAGGGLTGDVFKTRDDYGKAWGLGLKAKAEAKAKGDRTAIHEADRALDALRAKARRSRFA